MASANPISLDNDNNFKGWLVVKLQQYLKDRGIVYSSYMKEQLVELCESAERLHLPVDPNFFSDSIVKGIERKLSQKGGQMYNNSTSSL